MSTSLKFIESSPEPAKRPRGRPRKTIEVSISITLPTVKTLFDAVTTPAYDLDKPQKQIPVSDEVREQPYEAPQFDKRTANANWSGETARQILARRHLLDFIQRFRPKYTAGWVHRDICRRLERFVQQVEARQSPRLLLMMPPRGGKSEIGSRHFPAWVLGHHPEWEIIAASHTSSLSLSFSRYIRDLMEDDGYLSLFPDSRIDPSSRSVENWNLQAGGGYLAAGVGTGITGRGCLAPYTLVDTNRGKIRIIDLKVGDSVYGYDHKEQKVVETRVKAVQVTERSKQLLDFGDVRLTTDHRIYNAARGFYTRAGESPNLLGLRRQEGSSRCDVQGVLFQSADRNDHNAQMRLLWEELSAQRGRAQEVAGSAWRGGESVLQSPLLRHVQDQQPSGLQQGEGRVSALQEAGDRDGSFEVLQQGLLQRVQGVETGDGCVQWRVFDAQNAGVGTGQEVLALRYDPRSVRSASHQSRRNGQPDFESGAAVHGVPPQISSVHGACAADIAGLFEPFDFVLDIQTGTGNFFTEGLLVHNCHILLLDDLVKDIEAADSQTIRDNTWEWYTSTAYTRLAPGGGVIGIMCMTGDTPVMMADGTQRRLDSLKPSDIIATYARGTLAATTVSAVKSSGRDLVFKIIMKSGRIVRANQRHPFLTVAPTGELSWTRLRNLTTALRIVVAKGSGVNGEALPALPRGASSLPNVADYAAPTTTSRNGLTDVVQRATATTHDATHASSTAMASPLLSMTPCMSSKADAAPYAANTLKPGTLPVTGRTSSPLTTVTTPEPYEDCSATTATQELDILVMNEWHLPPLGISDFTLDEIISIEPDGEEEVFDVQVDHTENFIANGAVSHNTWWHDDDWAGRIQQVMAAGEGDHFEVIRYPAINDQGDEYILEDDTIIQVHPDAPLPTSPGIKQQTRAMNTALHPARYDTDAMLRIKRNLVASGQARIWNALYQQNPLPDDGILFTKDMFRYYGGLPPRQKCYVYQAWDFAITEGSENDYTVGATLYQDEDDRLYVADIRRFRSADSFVIVDEILDYAAEHGAFMIGMEDGQIWKAMEAVFQRRCEERRQYPTIEVLKPLTDKLVRASPLRGRMQLGKVYFDEKAHWFRELFTEMTRFPNTKHDDQVDALAWAVRLTLSHAAPRIVEKEDNRAEKSWRTRLAGMIGGAGSHMSA